MFLTMEATDPVQPFDTLGDRLGVSLVLLRNIAGSFFPPKGKSHAPYEPRASTANQAGWGTPGRKSKGIDSKRSVQTGQTAGWREWVAPNLQNDLVVRGSSR